MELDGLGGSLLAAAQDVLEAVLQEVDAAALRQLKAASVAWCAHARRELCNRLWVRLSRRAGQPEPAGVDSITDLDVECLNEAGRPWEAVVAGRQLPQLARLHGYGFVVDVQAVREADLDAEEDDDDAPWDDNNEEDEDAPLGDVALRSCIQGEGQPPDELLLAAVACAASGKVRGVPVQRLGEDDAIDELDLSLCQPEIGDTGATLLALMLPAATSLCCLDIGLNRIGDEGASALAAILKETMISNLNLRYNRLSPEGGAAIAEGLKGNSALQVLDLGWNDVGAESASALAAVLEETQITNLNLRSNNLDNYGRDMSGLLKLVEILPQTKIENLDIGNSCIGDEGATKLAAILKETKITKLIVSENRLGTEGGVALAEGLKGNTTLQSLDLERNSLGPEAGAALAAGLKGNSTLQVLRIGFNHVTGDAADFLAKAVLEHASMTDFCSIPLASLRENSVTELNLERKGIGEPGAIVLSKLLPSAATVKSLNIRDNHILAKGVSALGAVLKETKITNLNVDGHALRIDELRGTKPTEKIDLSWKRLGVASAIIIASCIKENGVLKELKLGVNQIKDTGASALAAVLKETQITKLDLWSNDISDQAKQAVRDAAGNGVSIRFDRFEMPRQIRDAACN